ncbi:hypothetical protein DW228_06085 [Bacteroides fragilis]|uniref:Uncharacterized protein n=1 Tax=Bacteroides fragilis TaxID=817 RepID=A0A396C9Q2_BACFG|nr:hypothetical protein [Bacteroides fragilis]RHH14366.1 hypothetical protein DW228_06085 [Bacteroides fragilis]
MSIELHPDIGQLDPDSLCYSIYSQLYLNFFNAQDQKDEEHPFGIIEGDGTSIRLRNTAYAFASAIAGSVTGGGHEGSGGALMDYLKKSGGDMAGLLRANFGFEAGIGNTRVLSLFEDEQEDKCGVQIDGALRVGGDQFYLGGKTILSYHPLSNTSTLQSAYLHFGDSSILAEGELTIGTKEKGIYLSPEMLLVDGNGVYHSGNANSGTVDWAMKNAVISGHLQVNDSTSLFGELKALQGVELGADGDVRLTVTSDAVFLTGFLSFAIGYGIKIAGVPVFVRTSEKDIQLGAVGGDVLLGNGHTQKIRLFAGIADIDGDNLLLSRYGAAYFPDSLVVRHHYGSDLLSSYRVDDRDEGMIVHRRLRFGDSSGIFLEAEDRGIVLSSSVSFVTPDLHDTIDCRTKFGHRASTSFYSPQNRNSASMYIHTDADFICTEQPLEAKGHVGIDGSFTRLADGILFFSNENYLLAVSDGIQHYGNAFFGNNISSEHFSSGFAGYGWAVMQNMTTGNIAATFDEVTIRKKMRVYELEVQKNAVTNGALWISNSCSGDKVEKLT